MIRIYLFQMLILIFSQMTYAKTITLKIKDSHGKNIDSAVVFLRGLKKTNSSLRQGLEVYQEGHEFHPKVLVVRKGEKVSFPNRDETQHSVYSFSKNKNIKTGLYKKGGSPSRTFNKEGAVVLGCNIHDWMVGFVYVIDSDYYTISKNGKATIEIDGIESVEIGVWHPKIRRNKTNFSNLKLKNDNNKKTIKISLK